MAKRFNKIACERVWNHLTENGPMSSRELYGWYLSNYKDKRTGGVVQHQHWIQTMLKSFMFTRCGYYHENGHLISDDPDYPKADLHGKVLLRIAARPIEDIIAPYVEGKSTLRRLDQMPRFVAKAVAEAKGDA